MQIYFLGRSLGKVPIKGAIFSLVVFLLATTGLALSQEKSSCEDANTQLELNECFAKQFKISDQMLNETYKKLERSLDHDHFLKLKKAQLTWIQFRDQHCEAQTFLSVGGSMHQMEMTACKATVTNARVEQLKEMLSDIER